MNYKSGFVALCVLLCVFPLSAAVTVRGGLTYEHTLAPGQTAEGVFELFNTDAEAQEVKLYQTDYFFYADGRVLYSDPGLLERSNARWISLTPPTVVIPPRESVKVRYTVQMPQDNTLEGSYWSMIMVEGVAHDSPESTQGGEGMIGLGVRQVFRYGIQVITNVGNTGAPKIRFASSRLVKGENARDLVLDLENTGTRWIRAAVTAELYDSSGSSVGKFEADPLRLYPGTSGRFKIDLSSVPNRTYKAFILVDGGGSELFGANITLVIE
ncbi:MAG TPA: hypothetical protein PKH40_09045 [Treponemataceae bacterium]|nr:MAG: hypothetical protein BWY39_01454 [Spirochaetes bacterium ADurb.Bin269]TAH55239.1 MAG: hypothetical protein EWM51_03390 [Treponema sp.]HOC29814.1 hypothetical protein [Treponemataceae bacterium]HPX46979.1 hypothetical protein [Treponemataceae bacterium]HQL32377.1 hypothetical protein [Treponemataceae bacterium]